MILRFLLDTHIVVRWITEPKRLSFEQIRIIRHAEKHGQPVGVSDMSLLEVASRLASDRRNIGYARQVLNTIESDSLFQVLPLTVEIAKEVMGLTEVLRDPSDCAIVATARIHGLRLLTSDQRIIQSNLVPVID